MTLLYDVGAERSLVACALYGSIEVAEGARAVLDAIPPTSAARRRLLLGHEPTLAAGLAERAAIGTAWPCADTIEALTRRVWIAHVRRYLTQLAEAGEPDQIQRIWAIARYLDPALGAEATRYASECAAARVAPLEIDRSAAIASDAPGPDLRDAW